MKNKKIKAYQLKIAELNAAFGNQKNKLTESFRNKNSYHNQSISLSSLGLNDDYAELKNSKQNLKNLISLEVIKQLKKIGDLPKEDLIEHRVPLVDYRISFITDSNDLNTLLFGSDFITPQDKIQNLLLFGKEKDINAAVRRLTTTSNILTISDARIDKHEANCYRQIKTAKSIFKQFGLIDAKGYFTVVGIVVKAKLNDMCSNSESKVSKLPYHKSHRLNSVIELILNELFKENTIKLSRILNEIFSNQDIVLIQNKIRIYRDFYFKFSKDQSLTAQNTIFKELQTAGYFKLSKNILSNATVASKGNLRRFQYEKELLNLINKC